MKLSLTTNKWERAYNSVPAPASDNTYDLWEYYNRYWNYATGQEDKKKLDWRVLLFWIILILAILVAVSWCFINRTRLVSIASRLSQKDTKKQSSKESESIEEDITQSEQEVA